MPLSIREIFTFTFVFEMEKSECKSTVPVDGAMILGLGLPFYPFGR